MLTLLFDGIAYGMLLFVLSLGLAVTMGLMNFINLAHGELVNISSSSLKSFSKYFSSFLFSKGGNTS